MGTLDIQPPASATDPSSDSKPALTQASAAAIADVIGNRILIPFTVLDKCFRIARGVGVSLHTVRGWEDEGMPHQHHPEDRYYYYDWDAVWRWYCERGRARRSKPKINPVLSQSWTERHK